MDKSKTTGFVRFIVSLPYTVITIAFFGMVIYSMFFYIKNYDMSMDPSDYEDLGVHTFHSVDFFIDQHYDDEDGYVDEYNRKIESEDGEFWRTEVIDSSEYEVDYTAEFRVIQSISQGDQYYICADSTAEEYISDMSRDMRTRKTICILLGVLWIISTAGYRVVCRILSF